jgi:hypothetical protein
LQVATPLAAKIARRDGFRTIDHLEQFTQLPAFADEDFELESNEVDQLVQDQEVRARKSRGREFTDIINGARYEKRTRN